MENPSKSTTVEWSRWITVGGSDPRDIAPSEYEGPVLIQFEHGRRIDPYAAHLVGGEFLIGGVVRNRVAR